MLEYVSRTCAVGRSYWLAEEEEEEGDMVMGRQTTYSASSYVVRYGSGCDNNN